MDDALLLQQVFQVLVGLRSHCGWVCLASECYNTSTLCTCEPVVPDAGCDVACGHDLGCDEVFGVAVHLHPIVALHEHYAEQEAAEDLQRTQDELSCKWSNLH